MKRLILVSAAMAAFAAAVCAGEIDGKVVYGKDDRLDLFQVGDARLLKLADSTVALFQSGDVNFAGKTAELATSVYGPYYGLCKEEPFYEQIVGAFCSGSLVAPDVIMTAGHCVRDGAECKGIKFVFGYGVRAAGVMPDSVPAAEVYGCAELIGREQLKPGADWALVRLDRKVDGHAPLKLNDSPTIKNGDDLVVIGHPMGLPTKVAGGAVVRDASPEGYFVANLDTFGGNSGSAVFNANTGEVEGILVRGESDFVYREQGDCRVSKVCPSNGCRGEDVTKITAITSPMRFLPRDGAPIARPAPAFGTLLEIAAL